MTEPEQYLGQTTDEHYVLAENCLSAAALEWMENGGAHGRTSKVREKVAVLSGHQPCSNQLPELPLTVCYHCPLLLKQLCRVQRVVWVVLRHVSERVEPCGKSTAWNGTLVH